MLAIPKPSSTPPLGNVGDAGSHPIVLNPPTLIAPAGRRPKLSLQTASLPTGYGGKSTTGMTKADANATITPTTRNTFANAFELSIRPSPTSATFNTVTPIIQTSAASTISTSSDLEATCPYKLSLPFGVKPILKNSPLSRDYLNSVIPSPRIPTRRVFFPCPKSVTFSSVLEEVVVNRDYTARHIDLGSSEDEIDQDTVKVEQDQPSPTSSSEESDGADCEARGARQASKRRMQRAGNDVCDEYRDGDDRGRTDRSRGGSSRRSRRKRRRWEWTITSTDGPATTASDSTAGQASPLSQTSTLDVKSNYVVVINTAEICSE